MHPYSFNFSATFICLYVSLVFLQSLGEALSYNKRLRDSTSEMEEMVNIGRSYS